MKYKIDTHVQGNKEYIKITGSEDFKGPVFSSPQAAVGAALYFANGVESYETFEQRLVTVQKQEVGFHKWVECLSKRKTSREFVEDGNTLSERFKGDVEVFKQALKELKDSGSLTLECKAVKLSPPANLFEEVVRALTFDELDGRGFGEIGRDRAHQYLEKKIREIAVDQLDIKVVTETFRAKNSFTGKMCQGKNLFVYTNCSSAAPVILNSAHYDHFSIDWLNYVKDTEIRSIRFSPIRFSPYMSGATDNAAAVAALVGAIPDVAESGVPAVFCFWDGEEAGFLGSLNFASQTEKSFDVSQLSLQVNLDIIGNDFMPSFGDKTSVLGADTGGEELENDSQEIFTKCGLEVYPFSLSFGYRRSDHESLFEHGIRVPTVFLSDGDGAVYHTSADCYSHVNFEKTKKISQAVGELNKKAFFRHRNQSPYRFHQPQYLSQSGISGKLVQALINVSEVIKIFTFDSPVMFTGLPMVLSRDLDALLGISKEMLKNVEELEITNKELVRKRIEAIREKLLGLRSQISRKISGPFRLFKMLKEVERCYSDLRDVSVSNSGMPLKHRSFLRNSKSKFVKNKSCHCH